MQQENQKLLRVCYFGTYRANFTRSRILLAGLRSRENVQVLECHSQLWHSIDDRVDKASGGWRDPRFVRRVLGTYWRLFRAHNRMPDYDVMLIGYPGQFDSYLARLLTWWRRKPMALDIHMSLYLVAEERGLIEKSPRTGRLISKLEKGGLKLPDLLFSENHAYEAYYCRQYALEQKRFVQVPHGADNRVFHPRPISPPEHPFRVTYHGGYLPSHGMEAIIGAAVLLRDEPDIVFHFFGEGPEKTKVATTAEKEALTNVHFHGFVSQDDLLDGIAQSHLCLGVFGMTKQSHYTIQNKVWEGLAMSRPVISGDSEVARESLVHGEHIYLVPRNDPQALAEAIRKLRSDPHLREAIARGGYERYLSGNSVEAIGRITEQALRSVVD